MTCTSQKISCHYPEWSIRWKIHFHDTEKLQKLKAKKIKENSFHYQENVFLLKLVPPVGFQQQKDALNKSILFPLKKNKFPPAGMKDLLKIMFSLDGKVVSGVSKIAKITRRFLKKISTKRKTSSTSSNKIFYYN